MRRHARRTVTALLQLLLAYRARTYRGHHRVCSETTWDAPDRTRAPELCTWYEIERALDLIPDYGIDDLTGAHATIFHKITSRSM